jgi:site-specific DNA-cytosine methylase
MNKLKLLDLFSGIGGFSLGLESTGFFETIAFVEKDKFCRKVLKKNFNNIPIEEDIRNVRGSNYAADIITGGFPCQPFSVAGKRKGTDDDRYLWDETIRVVAECKPRWFIGENVEGLININNGVVLRQVQTDLEDQGFQVQCLVVPAAGIGAWHQSVKESGLWLTPTATEMGARSEEALQKRKEYRSKIGRNTVPPGNLAEQVHYGMATTNMYPTPTSVQRPNEGNMRMMRKQVLQGNISREDATAMVGKDIFKAHGKVRMYPTPTVGCEEVGEQSSRVEMTDNGGFILRKKNKPEMTFGAKLSDAMLYLNKTKPGGKLNPNFVEFLMGYPLNWTKIDPAE